MRKLFLVLVIMSLSSAPVLAEPAGMDVRKTAGCGCCVAWIGQMKQSGYAVRSQNMAFGDLTRFKKTHGIGEKQASCHTARIAGYTIEGHVPIREIRRLLKEKPDAIGLAVPGMPVGSPGMEDGTTRDAFNVLLIRKNGMTEVYARYPARR